MNTSAHLCLVSAQPTPNLTPVLDPAVAPRKVFLLVSPDMTQRADWLEAVIRPRGIVVERWPVDNPWAIDAIRDSVLNLLAAQSDLVDRREIALNATGGTKPMSIAAYDAFRTLDLPIFYVHPEQDCMIWMHPRNIESRALADRVRLEDFLRAHGASIETPVSRNIRNPRALEVGDRLVAEMKEIGFALARLNGLVSDARNGLVTEPIADENGAVGELADVFAIAGYLSWDQRRLRFSSEADRRFVNGGWLETWVFEQVRRRCQVDPRIQDAAYGVNVVRTQRDKPVRNELDVVFLRDNRLHVIECKTARFANTGLDDRGADALYKLDTLRDLLGGLQARGMLVSYGNLDEHDRRRAADLGIHVCAGDQLRQLSDHLSRFTRA